MLLFIAGTGTLLLSRYWLLPGIERYHDQVAYALGNAVGRPATIGRIEADWHGFRPHLLMVNVRFPDRQGAVALALDKVEGEVSWTSLFAGEFRLYSLALDQPDLAIKRDARGEIFVAGIPVSGAPSDGSTADWLLNQSRIEVRDARVTWRDELRGAPPLTFNGVNLLIDNGWRHHRFALSALPPKELSAQLDVRGDFRGASFHDLSDWKGQLFTQLDYADVAAWRTWLTLPIQLSSGKGAMRSWVEVENGRVSLVTADLALSSVRTRLASDVPVLDLRSLHGRVGWRDGEQGMEVSTRNLSLRLRNGFELAPTDFFLRYALSPDQGRASGAVRANKLDLLGLSTLSEYLPFNRGFKRKLAAFAPRGKVTDLQAEWDWQGDADKLLRFKIKARFAGMAMQQVGDIPGFSGLTGRVDGSDENGNFSLNSRNFTLNAPGIMSEKLLFDSISAQVGWHTDRKGVEVTFSNVALVNPDMNGVLSGTYHTLEGSPGEVDISGHFKHAAARHVDRYIPIAAVGKDTHAWLNSGLIGGRSDDASLRLAGDLSKFPFPDSKGGVFQVRARIKDATLEFHKNWPRIENINGDLLIDGKRLEVTVPAAATADNALRNISAVIPDLISSDLSLQVRGEAAGETARALEYIRKSPVRAILGGFTDDATALGDGELKLRLDIPLLGGRPVKVDGSYRLKGGDIDLGSGIPLLQHISGELQFTESSVSSRNLALTTLGGPAALEVKSAGNAKVITVNASGNANMDALREVSPHPLLRYLHGVSPWNLAVTVQGGQADVLFNSSLLGLISDLPAPFDKRAGEKIPLRFGQKRQGDQQQQFLQYGELMNALLVSRREASNWKLERGLVAFGSQKKWPERKGLWLVGEIPHLSLVGWMPLLGMIGGESGKPGAGPGIEGADLLIRKVTGYGQSVADLRVFTTHGKSGEVPVYHLASKEIAGEVTWLPEGKGALRMHLKNLALSEGGKGGSKQAAEGGEGKPVPAVEEKGAGASPEIELKVENLAYQGKQLGNLDLQAKQSGGDWSLDHVLLTNPDGKLTAKGIWLTSGAQPQTQLNFRLEISDIGRILARSGYPDSVKKGGGSLEGALTWNGDPGDFNYSVLGGRLDLRVGKGQFLKIDPEVSGLLRILSLQAFRFGEALFGEGFAFDKITGTANINKGVLTTDDFIVDGVPAKVTMKGMVDLNHETQNLNIVIEPSVGSGAALLVAAIANPLAGLEFLIVNKLFRGPVEKVASIKYDVTGTWAKPIVSKVGDKKAAPVEIK
ncbi:MAG TPA: YhdP family protein [Gallionellaceae bacterium]